MDSFAVGLPESTPHLTQVTRSEVVATATESKVAPRSSRGKHTRFQRFRAQAGIKLPSNPKNFEDFVFKEGYKGFVLQVQSLNSDNAPRAVVESAWKKIVHKSYNVWKPKNCPGPQRYNTLKLALKQMKGSKAWSETDIETYWRNVTPSTTVPQLLIHDESDNSSPREEEDATEKAAAEAAIKTPLPRQALPSINEEIVQPEHEDSDEVQEIVGPELEALLTRWKATVPRNVGEPVSRMKETRSEDEEETLEPDAFNQGGYGSSEHHRTGTPTGRPRPYTEPHHNTLSRGEEMKGLNSRDEEEQFEPEPSAHDRRGTPFNRGSGDSTHPVHHYETDHEEEMDRTRPHNEDSNIVDHTRYGKGELSGLILSDNDDEDDEERRYDADGFDSEGYDNEGFDREGYDEQGWDRNAFNKQGHAKTRAFSGLRQQRAHRKEMTHDEIQREREDATGRSTSLREEQRRVVGNGFTGGYAGPRSPGNESYYVENQLAERVYEIARGTSSRPGEGRSLKHSYHERQNTPPRDYRDRRHRRSRQYGERRYDERHGVDHGYDKEGNTLTRGYSSPRRQTSRRNNAHHDEETYVSRYESEAGLEEHERRRNRSTAAYDRGEYRQLRSREDHDEDLQGIDFNPTITVHRDHRPDDKDVEYDDDLDDDGNPMIRPWDV